jgi:hypothetical protein
MKCFSPEPIAAPRKSRMRTIDASVLRIALKLHRDSPTTLTADTLASALGALGERCSVESVASEADLASITGISPGRCDLFIMDALDPMIRCGGIGVEIAAVMFAMRLRAIATPVVLLCGASAEALQLMAPLWKGRSVELAFLHDDGAMMRLDAAVRSAGARTIAVRAFDTLARLSLAELDSHTLDVVENVFRHPKHYETSESFVALNGISTSVFNARLRRAGIKPFRVLRRCARVAHVWQLVNRLGADLTTAITLTGCGSTDSLERACSMLADMSPGRLCRELDAESVIDAVVRLASSGMTTTVRSAGGAA